MVEITFQREEGDQRVVDERFEDGRGNDPDIFVTPPVERAQIIVVGDDHQREELAEKVYVTRQTISNWENEKSYPDIHSLLLLSSLFNVSLDQLIKGDIEKMKEIISEQEIKKFNYYGSIYTVHLAVLIISAVPLFMWLGRYAYIPFGILFIITMYWALKVEKLKKKNDIQTYKEIVAFTEGKKLDELHKAVEVGKRPYQNILKVIISAGVTAMICFLIGVLMHVFLN